MNIHPGSNLFSHFIIILSSTLINFGLKQPSMILLRSSSIWFMWNKTLLYSTSYLRVKRCQNYHFKHILWHILIKSEGITFWNICLYFQPPVFPVGNSYPEIRVKQTSKPTNELSNVHWIFQKLITFGDELF